MRSLTAILASGMVTTLACSSRAQKIDTCLHYGPDTVAVTGTLTRETFPGPPNYESVDSGDAPETGFYLRPSSPICMIASPDSDSNDNGALHDVRSVQLVLDSAGYARLRPELGQRITLRGPLFAAFTGHHHAPVLLTPFKLLPFKPR